MVGEPGGGPRSDECAGQKTEADKGEVEGFGAALFACGGPGGFVGAFGDVAQVAGDEGGGVGEAVDDAEACDLEGGDVGDGGGEGHLGKGVGKRAKEEEDGDLEEEADADGTGAEAVADVFRGGDAGEKGCDRDDVAEGLEPVAADGGDGEENDVAGHGVGEDVTVVEVDDGVEQAPGGSEEHGIGEGVGLDRGLRHRGISG